MTCGITFVVFGRSYDRLAAHTLFHSRKFTQVPFQVITNLPPAERDAYWKCVTGVTFTYLPEEQRLNRNVKTLLHEYTIFDRTLYLDCDSAIMQPGVERIFALLDTHDFVLAKRYNWDQLTQIPEVYVRTFRILGTRLPVFAWHGALFAFDRNNKLACELLSQWNENWRKSQHYRDLPPLIAATARYRHDKGMRIAQLDENYFTLKDNVNALIWHPQPGKPEAFLQRLQLPDWVPWSPDEQRYERWNMINENDPLANDRLLTRKPCPKTGPLCIVAYAFGDYIEYAPIFAFSALWSYPEAVVRIYTPGPVPAHVLAAIDYIRQQLSSNVEIIANYKDATRSPANPTARGNQNGKMIRWLIPGSEFTGFANVYMADIDFVIVPEQPTLMTQHLQFCAAAGLPYSNPQRWSYNDRVSGLQFVKTMDYFAKMDPIITPYRTGERVLPDINNEQFLYELLCAAGIGPTGKPATRQLFDMLRPHHGFHLGLVRNYTEPQEYLDLWQKYSKTAGPIVQSPMYAHLLRLIKLDWVSATFRRLRAYLDRCGALPQYKGTPAVKARPLTLFPKQKRPTRYDGARPVARIRPGRGLVDMVPKRKPYVRTPNDLPPPQHVIVIQRPDPLSAVPRKAKRLTGHKR